MREAEVRHVEGTEQFGITVSRYRRCFAICRRWHGGMGTAEREEGMITGIGVNWSEIEPAELDRAPPHETARKVYTDESGSSATIA